MTECVTLIIYIIYTYLFVWKRKRKPSRENTSETHYTRAGEVNSPASLALSALEVYTVLVADVPISRPFSLLKIVFVSGHTTCKTWTLYLTSSCDIERFSWGGLCNQVFFLLTCMRRDLARVMCPRVSAMK